MTAVTTSPTPSCPQSGYSYFLRSFNFDSRLTIHTVSGYDNVTGVGTPNGAAFLSALSS